MVISSREFVKLRKNYLFLPHALRQMSRPKRMISTGEIRQVIEQGKIIEDYPEDARGHSCLMLGNGEANRLIYVVCQRTASRERQL